MEVSISELRQNSDYVMYLGFPMRLYFNCHEPILWGFWSWIPVVFALEPMLFGSEWAFIKYQKGQYFKTLLNFLLSKRDK